MIITCQDRIVKRGERQSSTSGYLMYRYGASIARALSTKRGVRPSVSVLYAGKFIKSISKMCTRSA